MTGKSNSPGQRLETLLRDDDGDSLRWSADVPVVTNPFILVDFLRFLIATGMIIFVVAAIPQWAYTRDLSPPRLAAILRLCALGCAVFAACLFAAGFVLLRNRFRATFVLNPWHIYYETARGGRGLRLFLGWKPAPTEGRFDGERAFAREIPWSKTDSFVGFPSVRTILLKRGIWEILKLYTPDEATYEKATEYLRGRLRERKP